MSTRDVFDVARLLVNFQCRCNHDFSLDRHRKGETSKGPCFPINGVAAVAVFLSVRAANTASAQECELLSESEQLSSHSVDVPVCCILMCNKLDNEGIICSEHAPD